MGRSPRTTSASRSFEPRPEAVVDARRFVSGSLRKWHIDCPDATLLVSELATNAVLHARSDFTVGVHIRGDSLRVEVFDRDPRLPAPTSVPADAHSGRGLTIVQGLASAWGVESRSGEGKTIWFELAGLSRDGASPRPGMPAD